MRPSALFTLIVLLVAGSASAQSDGGVPKPLLSRFKRGINVTRWFCYLKNPDDTSHFQTYLTPADFNAFKSLGVTWIRLCVSPQAIYQDGKPNAKTLPFLDEGIRKLEDAGMAVSLDLHDRGQLKLDEPDHDNRGFVTFWEEMARHYAAQDEDRLVFELVNEPQFRKNPDVWYELQEKTVKAIRAVDPKRTIMVSGISFSSIDRLSKMKPLEESNLLYTVHSYDPFTFTHQGASWTKDPPKGIKGLTFPSSPENSQEALKVSTPEDQAAITTYGDKRYDAAYLKARVAKAFAYGEQNHVPIVLGEFGVYPKECPPEARTRWFEAMRAALEASPVANSLWAYDDSEGLGRKIEDGKLWLDPVTLQALYGVVKL